MDEEIESSSGASILPIAMAVLAVALGGAGLYFGINASQQVSPLADSIDSGTSSVARLEKQLSSIETRLAEIGASSEQLGKTVERLRIYGTQSEQAVKQVASAARSNREEIVTLAGKMNELAESITSGGSTRSAPPGPGQSSDSSSQSRVSASVRPALAEGDSDAQSGSERSGRSYRIQAGDTFAKIATKLGISLNALIDANPDADTRRLQIGQTIQLP